MNGGDVMPDDAQKKYAESVKYWDEQERISTIIQNIAVVSGREYEIYPNLCIDTSCLDDLKSYLLIDLGLTLDELRKNGVFLSYILTKWLNCINIIDAEDREIQNHFISYAQQNNEDVRSWHRKRIPRFIKRGDLATQMVSEWFGHYYHMPEFEDHTLWNDTGRLIANREPPMWEVTTPYGGALPVIVQFNGDVTKKYSSIIDFLSRQPPQHQRSLDDLISGD